MVLHGTSMREISFFTIAAMQYFTELLKLLIVFSLEMYDFHPHILF